MVDTHLLRGENQRVRIAQAMTVMDLSGAAVADNIIFHAPRACTLLSVALVYQEATSADTGVAIKVGKESDDDYYYTGTSEVSKAAWYEADLTLLKTDVAAGDTVVCSSAGSKTGTGTVLVVVEYKVNQ